MNHDLLVCYTTTHSDWLKTPFALTLDGQPWVAATNGRILIALAGATTHKPPEMERPLDIASILVLSPESAETTVEALREFCGTYPHPLPFCVKCCNRGLALCAECKGIGEMECDLGHKHDCEECDGSGATDAPCGCGHEPEGDSPPMGRILGQTFDLNLLGQALHHFAGPCRYGLAGETELWRLVVHGEGWRVALMGCKDENPAARREFEQRSSNAQT